MEPGQATLIRRATAQDIAAVTALRALMFAAMGAEPEELADGQWQAHVRRWLQLTLRNPQVNVTVAVVNGATVACAIGEVVERMPSPRNPTGQVGMLGSVATFPEYRMTGLGQACIDDVMSWFVEQTEVTTVELNATPQGRRRYLSHGFVETAYPQMRLKIPR